MSAAGMSLNQAPPAGRSPAAQPLRILAVTGSYWPDATGMAPLNAELCEYLAARGYSVSVVTGFPHYPEWSVHQAYRGRRWQREERNGVTIHRGWIWVPGKRTPLRRILYDTIFGLSALVRGLPAGPADLVLCFSPPLQIAVAAAALARMRGAPLVLQVKDLVPDLAIALGMLRNPAAIRAARALERFVYRRADSILVLCESFAAQVRAGGAAAEKICVAPDWVDTDFIGGRAQLGNAAAEFRRELGTGDSAFLAMHTGNMGAKQNLDNLLNAAALEPRGNVVYALVGDGAEKARLEQSARARGLANIRFLPLVPRARLPAALAAADALLLNQSSSVGSTVLPSKLLTYMAAGRPVVAAVPAASEAARAVERGGCGVVVAPEDPAAFSSAVLALAAEPARAVALGSNGRRYALENFSARAVLPRIEALLLAQAARPPRAAETRARAARAAGGGP